MAQVLVVEGDDTDGRYAELVLRHHGYDVCISKTGAGALQAVESTQFDIILIGLPDVDGIELCKQLRAGSDAVIIFVTARSDEPAKVLGLDAGADDYVTKPFSVGELTARIRAILRRQRSAVRSSVQRLETGGIALDLSGHRVIAQGEDVAVTRTEFKLLRMLMSDAGRVVRREQILEAVWGPNYFGDPNILDVHMSGLRRKLKGTTGQPDLLQTVRGVGYRFREPPAA